MEWKCFNVKLSAHSKIRFSLTKNVRSKVYNFLGEWHWKMAENSILVRVTFRRNLFRNGLCRLPFSANLLRSFRAQEPLWPWMLRPRVRNPPLCSEACEYIENLGPQKDMIRGCYALNVRSGQWNELSAPELCSNFVLTQLLTAGGANSETKSSWDF